MLHMTATLAEFQCALIVERTCTGLIVATRGGQKL